MRKFVFVILATVLPCLTVNAGVLKGSVKSSNGNAVEYATVVVLSDGVQKGGTVTDSIGNFELQLPDGKYRAVFTSVGYEKSERDVAVTGTTEITVEMAPSTVMMKEVEVRASAIRREPDRFVMMVEDMPAAIGKDGKELLRDAPGVWIDDDKISINGKSGTKVYVNDRELKMGNDQLQAFLKSLKAEDVSKVEVIPQAGSEYSADSSAGIIKITMKRNRADGVMGNVGISSGFGKDVAAITPSAAINVKKGKWTFNLNGQWEYGFKQDRDMTERNNYANGMVYNTDTHINADGLQFGNVLAGIFYDIDAKNSLGLEVNFSNFKNPSRTTTDANFNRIDKIEFLNGNYITHGTDRSIDATFNYLHRLDSLGSTMKVIANFSRSNGKQDMDNRRASKIVEGYGIPPKALPDSVYRSNEHSIYDVANISYDFDKKFNQKWNLSAGAKYTMNRMDNSAYYDYLKDQQWKPSTAMNYDYVYTENIYALYAKGTAKFGRLSAVAGLRVEHTDASSRGNLVDQNYWDFFPNAYLSYSLDEMSANTLTLNYSRYIERPSFWSLNPIRRQSSDYFYQTGNPDLKPAYKNTISLTGVYKYRYSLSLWVDVSANTMFQGSLKDPVNPDNILFSTVNMDDVYNFGASVNLPFQFTDWWSLNVSPTYIRRGERLNVGDKLSYHNLFFMNTSTGVQLPKDFYVSLSYYFMPSITQGEMTVGPFHFMNASIKKSFAGNRWTAALNANNILANPIKFRINTDAYSSYTKMSNPLSVGVSLTYNFNVGKMFQAKKIESNDDASRRQKSSGAGM